MYKNIFTASPLFTILLSGVILSMLYSCAATTEQHRSNKPERPNIVIIFADDLGFADIGRYDAKGIETPNIDAIGQAGFTSRDFFIPANVCSPARASLLTGRYPMRNGVPVAINLLSDKHHKAEFGLPTTEVTLPELLKPAGYRSLMVGKWHLGFFSEGSHPIDAGFDEHFGIAGNYAAYKKQDPRYTRMKEHNTLYRGYQPLQHEVPLQTLTKRYTDEVIDFIEQQKQPFLVYFAHNIAHSPHRPSKAFAGSSNAGKYGDFIQEMDHSTGRILETLKRLKIEDNTLVIFASDNGANFKGDNGILNGGKYTTMEGGHIVPAMFKWPQKIPKNIDSNTSITLMDIFPLLADITGAPLPSDRVLDGKNIFKVLTGEQQESPHKVLYYYNGTNLQAVRKGKWKLHLPRTVSDQPYWHKNSAGSRVYTELTHPLLFDLEQDRQEKHNLAKQYPDIVKSFIPLIEQARAELGDVNQIGSDQKLPPFEDIQNIHRWWQKP